MEARLYETLTFQFFILYSTFLASYMFSSTSVVDILIHSSPLRIMPSWSRQSGIRALRLQAIVSLTLKPSFRWRQVVRLPNQFDPTVKSIFPLTTSVNTMPTSIIRIRCEARMDQEAKEDRILAVAEEQDRTEEAILDCLPLKVLNLNKHMDPQFVLFRTSFDMLQGEITILSQLLPSIALESSCPTNTKGITHPAPKTDPFQPHHHHHLTPSH